MGSQAEADINEHKSRAGLRGGLVRVSSQAVSLQAPGVSVSEGVYAPSVEMRSGIRNYLKRPLQQRSPAGGHLEADREQEGGRMRSRESEASGRTEEVTRCQR